jgi:polyisoprenoid-binding protein YceI
LAVLAVGGTWVYFNLIRDDPPERLTLESSTDSTPSTGTPAAAVDDGAVAGTWTPTAESVAGYRVKEVVLGQSGEAVGRTNKITGSLVIDGTTVTSASFTVDMASIASDESRRDNQFRGRIMDVSTYPTSTFTLTAPIQLAGIPAPGERITAESTGMLTLKGTTKTLTVPLAAQRDGATLKVQGSIPIVFDEWGIDNPSGGPAQTEDHGELEFLLMFEKG